jgi:hypothetical protein
MRTFIIKRGRRKVIIKVSVTLKIRRRRRLFLSLLREGLGSCGHVAADQVIINVRVQRPKKKEIVSNESYIWQVQ